MFRRSEMEQVSFAAPWDSLIKGVSSCIFALIVFLGIVFTFIVDNLSVLVGILALYSAILVVPYLWSPRAYIVASHKIVVKRLIGDFQITVAQKPERWKWTWWGIRLFGSGGLYGYFGYFSFRGLGRVCMHATNRNNLVLVSDEKGRRFLLSPSDPDRFIQLFRP
jgi:Bacterial PH domain